MRDLLGAGGTSGVIFLWALFLPHLVGRLAQFPSATLFTFLALFVSVELKRFSPVSACVFLLRSGTPFLYRRLSPLARTPARPLSLFLLINSVQELIDTAPGDVECPTCSEPLTVDLSGGSPGGNDQDEAESDEVEGGRGRGRGRKGAGGGGRNGSRGRGGAGRDRGGGSRGSNDVAKGRMANMVATLAASVKKTLKNKKHASRTGFKSSVTKHSVINRIDLSKFQSVSWRFTEIIGFREAGRMRG